MGHRIIIPESAEAQLTFWTDPDRRPRPKTFVYVLQAEGTTPIKVGTAMDVRTRMGELQTGNPRPLRLCAVLLGSYDLEHALHEELSGYRLVGEWFDDSPSIEWFVDRMTALAEKMYVKYHLEKRIPSFEEFSPFRERLQEGERPPVVMPFETPPIGRLSSARPLVVDSSPQREAERERRGQVSHHWGYGVLAYLSQLPCCSGRNRRERAVGSARWHPAQKAAWSSGEPL
jgi:T5orf172 domain